MKNQYQRVVSPETELQRACRKCGHVATAFSLHCPMCGAKVGNAGTSHSVLGIIGFILAIPGVVLFPLGILGALLCLIGLFGSKKKLFCILGLLLGIVGIGVAVAQVVHMNSLQFPTHLSTP